ncbi:uncharacterized protein LOC134771384 [Penaeus indicus]|uniref:uncharacterized protein LOC134771384 n=1 Tax=Penaeus indicus TaxID=29960 RepID=UPI00300C1975
MSGTRRGVVYFAHMRQRSQGRKDGLQGTPRTSCRATRAQKRTPSTPPPYKSDSELPPWGTSRTTITARLRGRTRTWVLRATRPRMTKGVWTHRLLRTGKRRTCSPMKKATTSAHKQIP